MVSTVEGSTLLAYPYPPPVSPVGGAGRVKLHSFVHNNPGDGPRAIGIEHRKIGQQLGHKFVVGFVRLPQDVTGFKEADVARSTEYQAIVGA